MLVVSWNIKAITGAAPDRLAAIVARLASVKLDVVLLQEVGTHVAEPLVRELKGLGLNVFFGGLADDKGKPYGNMIASHWPLSGVAPGWAKAPWPQLLTRATVTIDGQDVDVIAAHIPNGSGNGWEKINTFNALADALTMAPRGPRILGGDFNEPRFFRPDGGLVSFGAKKLKDGTYSLEGELRSPKRSRVSQPPESHPRRLWNDGVTAILGWGAPHGLRHAHHAVHGFEVSPATHVVQRKPRFFDHILVSKDFAVEDSGFFHGWRTDSPSDHSAAWVKLRLERITSFDPEGTRP